MLFMRRAIAINNMKGMHFYFIHDELKYRIFQIDALVELYKMK